jgi:membrane-bound lytic murein transglycosylase D
MASIILARNPEKYGLPKELEAPLRFERIPVSKPIDLRAAAKLLGISVEQLKELNPALRGLSTPPSYPDIELRVPVGAGPGIPEKVAALPAVRFRPQPEYGDRYRVRPGDTLGGIAARLGVSAAALQSANGIRSPRSLKAGMWLSVPSSGSRRNRIQSSRIASTRIASPAKPSSVRKSPAGKSSPGRSVSTASRGITGKPAQKGSAAASAKSAPRKTPDKPSPKGPPKEVASR